MFRGILRKAIQAVKEGHNPKGILRRREKAAFVQTSAGSAIRD